MAWYKDWFGTRYYELLYDHRDAADAKPWVDAIVEGSALAKGSKVLDMACGRGRHAKWFVQHGMYVHGIDLSAKSIAEARSMVPEAHFDVHDMRTPYAKDGLDMVVCLFSSLGYSMDEDDDRAIFRTAALALRPTGTFVLDTMNPYHVIKGLVPYEIVERNGITFEIEREVKDRRIEKRIAVTDGVVLQRFIERVRLYTMDELEDMARAAGMDIVEWTDGPVMEPFKPEKAARAVMWARKTG